MTEGSISTVNHEDYTILNNDSSDSFTNEQNTEIELLRKKNAILLEQINRTLSLEPEFESLHIKNRELSNQYLCEKQKVESYQDRLKIAQQKSAGFETENKQLKNQIQTLLSEIDGLKNTISGKDKELDDLKKDFQNAKTTEEELRRHYNDISSTVGHKITNGEQIIHIIKKLTQDVKMKEEEGNTNLQQYQNDSKASMDMMNKKLKKSKHVNSVLSDENYTLTGLVRRQQASLESVRRKYRELEANFSQVRKALSTCQGKLSSTNADAETAKVKFEQEIRKLGEDLRKQQELVAVRDQRIVELTEIINDPVQNGSERITELMRENTSIKFELQTESTKRMEIEEMERRVEDKLKKAIIKVFSLKKENARLKAQNHELVRRQREHLSPSSPIRRELELQSTQITKYANDIDQLNISIADKDQKIAELKMKLDKVSMENNNLNIAYASIEQNLNNQKVEIEQLIKDRSRISGLAQKMILLLNVYERKVSELKADNDDLGKRLKQKLAEKRCQFEPQLNYDTGILSTITQTLIPKLNSQIGEKISQILTDSKFPIGQRLQRVFAELATACNEIPKAVEPEPREITNTNLIIDYTIHSFSDLLQQKAISDKYNLPAQRNPDIITYLTSMTAQLEYVLKQTQLSDPQFSSLSFLHNGSMEDRRRCLQEISIKGWDAKDTFDMFCIQVLVNVALNNELIFVRNEYQVKMDQLGSIESIFGTSEPDGIAENLDLLVSRIKKLKRTKRMLRSVITELQSSPHDIDAIDQSAYHHMRDLEKSLDKMIDKVDSLNQVSEAQKTEIYAKSQRIEELESENNSLKSEIRQLQLNSRNEVAQFEKSIFQANQETREVNLKMAKMATEFDAKLQESKRAYEDLKNKAHGRQEKLVKALTALKEKRDRYEKSVKAREKNSQKEIQKLVESEKLLRTKFEESMRAMKDQNVEKCQFNRQLSEELQIKDEKVQDLTKELAKVSSAKRNLEVQLMSLEEQLKRETEVLSSQFNFKFVAAETRHQEELSSYKVRFEKEKSSLILSVLEEFDALQDLGDEDINTSNFLATIRRIASEYKRVCCNQES